MLDNDFEDPDVDRWVSIFEEHQPDVGVIADAFTREEAREYVTVAEELRDRFPDSELVIVPKCDCFDLIPQWVVLGYAAGGGDTEARPTSIHDRSPRSVTAGDGASTYPAGRHRHSGT